MEVSLSQDFDTNQWRSEVWMCEKQEFQLLEKKKTWKSKLKTFRDCPPNFRRPSSESWPRAMGFSHWRRISETVLRTFAHRPPKLGRELLISVNEGEFQRSSSEVSHHVVRNFQKSRISCFSPFSRFLRLFFGLCHVYTLVRDYIKGFSALVVQLLIHFW